MAEVITPRIEALRAHVREAAGDLRTIGLELDRDPTAIDRWLHLPAVDIMRSCTVPAEYLTNPLRIGGETYDIRSCLEHAVTIEELSYGDAGFMLACPGPLMSGAAVDALGDDKQRHAYYQRLARPEPTWTFFGLTEPAKGSAATELETALVPDGDGFRLTGQKRYVGNAAFAQLGVVFCRRAPGPLGIEAVLLDTDSPGFHAELIETVGLRGARISAIRFQDVRVERSQILGYESLKPSRRGLVGAIRTLQRFRPVLAGTALGLSRAVLDHVRTERPRLSRVARLRLEAAQDRLAAARARNYQVAAAIDAGQVRLDRIAGVKTRAAELAEQSTLLAADLLGPAALLEDPLLDKLYRDARAFEFMEGTGHIQRLAVFQGVLKGTFLDQPEN
ncbi:alkylation response protein AidB-like acyl-CoA dehydrogenase [Kitasatospora sp. MAA4]|uniref:acyl-CoA dehydrogenase family protein n=1 Tax=Kitasatospora sp. MAA4 TaxID=3035093 RepID=UPI0024732F44|nr:acyl-CoA dehydrogenase [Kitasatospora sp. MAA4]MDH6134308.1 alkylation response protein AidB-like acyl-CoA dehydrogenase [Kitasatospora sp. MAA4]